VVGLRLEGNFLEYGMVELLFTFLNYLLLIIFKIIFNQRSERCAYPEILSPHQFMDLEKDPRP